MADSPAYIEVRGRRIAVHYHPAEGCPDCVGECDPSEVQAAECCSTPSLCGGPHGPGCYAQHTPPPVRDPFREAVAEAFGHTYAETQPNGWDH